MSEEIKFGTDGWRGIIGKDFNLKNVAAVAQAISGYLGHNAAVALGYDTRRLSRESARLISRVLAANRIKVMLSHCPLPTQAVSYAVRSKKCTAGIMVTASHNPVHYNGIKIKGSFGGPLGSAATRRIAALVFRHPVHKISLESARRQNLLKETDLVSGYLRHLQSYLKMPLLKKAGLKILFDSMHGTADAYPAQILQGSSCRVNVIHNRPDSSFGGVKPEPILSCLKEAAGRMRQGGFDIGLASDGDADRVAAFDERGGFVNPQQIMALLLLHLIRFRKLKGAVVTTISGTALVKRIAGRYKLKLYETPVGFKHISQLMQEKDVLIGGEEAGGIGFKNYLPERDGILAGLLLVEMLAAGKKPFTQLLQDMQEEFGRFFYLRKDIKCRAADKDRIRTRLKRMGRRKSFAGQRIKQIQNYDGLKFHLADGSWILFRLSGTEPVLRIYAEAGSLAKTKELIRTWTNS